MNLTMNMMRKTKSMMTQPVTMACDDCDYRWKISLEVEDEEEAYEEDLICPMCGSSNVAEI